MTVSKLRQMKGLEAENGQLKCLLADAMLDISGLKGLLAHHTPRIGKSAFGTGSHTLDVELDADSGSPLNPINSQSDSQDPALPYGANPCGCAPDGPV